jgi:phosphopantetheine adenylyltransferase
MAEKPDKHIVFSYGRMNPPTAGHSKVVDKVKSHADSIGANHAVVVSHSQNKKDNPLHHEHKKEYLKHIHPDVNFEHSTKEHPHFLAQLKKFNQEGHTHATMVVGSDRVKDFKSLAKKYNGKEYNYKKINILSAGHRDPDAEGVAGISGTKMRNHASNNDFKSFKAGLHPNHSDDHAKRLFKATRQGMSLQKEERGMLDFKTFLTEQC